MNPLGFEEIVVRLAKVIDPDEPPGIAARNLARAAVALLHDRSGNQAVLLEGEMVSLALSERFRRDGPEPEPPNDEGPPTEPDGAARRGYTTPSPLPALEPTSGGPERSTWPPRLPGSEATVREAPPGGPVPEGHEGGADGVTELRIAQVHPYTLPKARAVALPQCSWSGDALCPGVSHQEEPGIDCSDCPRWRGGAA